MPVIRFVREGRDVECYPGENLREVALREGIELYGLKGKLGNCGGCGQCITCFVDVVPAGSAVALSPRTGVEDRKLMRRPQTWRLACQALVEHSVLVVTRPQAGEAGLAPLLEGALARPLPPGPTAWPEPPADEADSSPDEDQPGAPRKVAGSDISSATIASATSGEVGDEAPEQR
jgi:ferredoxin